MELEPDTAEIGQKVTEYEKFLNERLKVDLQKTLDSRDEIYAKMSEYLQLKTNIERMQEVDFPKGELRTKVDLGCNFYVQAKVPDVSKIFVAVGFGFYVEFTHSEALKFIDKKIEHLTEHAERLTKDSGRIKAHIRLVIEGLKELQGLQDGPEEQEFRDIWG
ncbi:protein UXT homolog [Branchiostoma floridae]|uniref:Protein UXT n=1 Tax=Branchiostoma floridae TaxID=7739 RepID=A0A9J7M1B0_BRAFL|nr:protein UXT homolog [Branchiostoma floridae]